MAHKTDGNRHYQIFQNVYPSSTIDVHGDNLVPAEYKLIANNTG